MAFARRVGVIVITCEARCSAFRVIWVKLNSLPNSEELAAFDRIASNGGLWNYFVL